MDNYLLKDGAVSIADYAFAYVSPRNITLPDSLKYIGKYAFYNSGLHHIDMDSVVEIGEYAFSECSDLINCEIGKSTHSIGKYAFYKSKLETIHISESVRTIGEGAFLDCKNLRDLQIDSLESWCKIHFGSLEANPLYYTTVMYLDGRNPITDLVIPDTIEEIYPYAFVRNERLDSVTISPSVKRIGDYAFYYCRCIELWAPEFIGLKTVSFGTSVQSIGSHAFDQCISLKTVNYAGNENEWNSITVDDGNDYLLNAEIQFGEELLNISNCSIILETDSFNYDGSEKKPYVIVKDGTKSLVSGTDYTVSYSNNIYAGIATVTVIGKGNYSGKATKEFFITGSGSKNISDCSVTLGAAVISYDGYQKEPSVVIKDGTKVLANGVDFTLAYSNNRDVGKATVIIKGIGSYTGTAYAYFTIERSDDKPLLGDADSNGSIEISDATFIQRFTALIEVVDTFNEYLADVNKDGNADLLDATCIQRYLADLRVDENIGFVDEDEPQASTETTIEYDNGDYVFVPGDKNLAYDEDESIVYYNNSLSVYLMDDINKTEENRLANLCGGTVSGRIKGSINILQIKVAPTDIKTLDNYSAILMKEDNVLYATYDFPTAIENESDNNPWTYDGKSEPSSEKGNEDNPSGNDWWAEAIGAYRAWDYSDYIKTPAKVGIIDNGIDTSHEEFFDNNNRSKIITFNSITAKDHGTHVAGIIAATDNNKGIRGISDQSELMFASIDFNNAENTLFPEFAAHTKEMAKMGACVINNSWGLTQPLNREDFERKEWNKQGGDKLAYWFYKKAWHDSLLNENAYNEYLSYRESVRQKTAMACMIMIIQLNDSHNDILIVQAAGNEGSSATNTGFYRAIDERLYREMDYKYSGKLSTIMSFEDIKSHIILVAAVENTREDGNYQICSFSNWGSTIDIAAPGKDILSTLTTKDDSEDPDDENNGKKYGLLSGTSMAAPMVTGSVALLKSIDPTLTCLEIKQILTSSTTRATGVGSWDYPMLNVGDAVEYVIENRINAKKPFISKRFNIHHDGIRISNGRELHDKILEDSSGTFYLANDIDLSETTENWEGRWDMLYEFDGTLYGNGYTIKNLYVHTGGFIAGMFKYMNNAKIFDVGFEKATIRCLDPNSGSAGIISAYSNSCIIENCYISNATVSSSHTAGGFIASADRTEFKDLYSNASVVGICHPGDEYVRGSFGGITGIYGDHEKKVEEAFVNCVVDSFIAADVNDDDWVESGRLCVGGIVGELYATTGSPQDLGFEEGGVKRDPKPIVFRNCSFTGEIHGHGGYAWDSVTYSSGKTMYKTCDVYTGGLIGYTQTDWGSGSGAWSGMVLVKDCTITASVTSSSMGMAYTGGVIGYAQVFTESEYGVEINNTTFNGTLNAYYLDDQECDIAHIGGAIGYLSGHCLLKNDVAEGKMTARSGWGLYLGGLVGDAPSDIQINNCNADNLDYDIDSRATGSFRNIGALVGRY